MRIDHPENPIEKAALAWASHSLISDATYHEVDAKFWLPANHGYPSDAESTKVFMVTFEAYGRALSEMVKLILEGEAVVLKKSDLELLRNAAVSIEYPPPCVDILWLLVTV